MENNSSLGSCSNLKPAAEEHDLGVMINSQMKLHQHSLLASVTTGRYFGIIKRIFVNCNQHVI